MGERNTFQAALLPQRGCVHLDATVLAEDCGEARCPGALADNGRNPVGVDQTQTRLRLVPRVARLPAFGRPSPTWVVGQNPVGIPNPAAAGRRSQVDLSHSADHVDSVNPFCALPPQGTPQYCLLKPFAPQDRPRSDDRQAS